MKLLTTLSLFLGLSISAHAFTRDIGIKITRDSFSEVKVSLYSNVPEENQKNISMVQACAIMSNTKDSGDKQEYLSYIGKRARGRPRPLRKSLSPKRPGEIPSILMLAPTPIPALFSLRCFLPSFSGPCA